MKIYLAVLNLLHADGWTDKYGEAVKALSQIFIASVPKRKTVTAVPTLLL
jgi:hypothetical protein